MSEKEPVITQQSWDSNSALAESVASQLYSNHDYIFIVAAKSFNFWGPGLLTYVIIDGEGDKYHRPQGYSTERTNILPPRIFNLIFKARGFPKVSRSNKNTWQKLS